ncbi:MAG: hypothetical protein ACXW1A_02135, partial [Nitrososphaeraceae archaeon]
MCSSPKVYTEKYFVKTDQILSFELCINFPNNLIFIYFNVYALYPHVILLRLPTIDNPFPV